MISTIILAAGKGKRMKNPDKPKVLFELNNKPLIEYVIELALSLDSDLIVPVVGNHKQKVMDFITERFKNEISKIRFAHQDKQLGTGHAVYMTKQYFENYNGDILILSGDVPLLSKATVDKFIDYHKKNGFDASLLSAIMSEPAGYGRIIRDEQGRFIDIREDKDASDEEKKIREINSGIYLINCRYLFEGIATLKSDNAQQEYYLTDIFRYFKDISLKIGALPVDDNIQIEGVNTVEQLAELESKLKEENEIRKK